MTDTRTAQIMAAMRGDRTDTVVEPPKLTGAAAEIAQRLSRHNAGSVPPRERPADSQAQFTKRAQEYALKHGVSRADAERAVREHIRREMDVNQRRQQHEAMVRRNRAEATQTAQAAIAAATKPRVQRLPNGNPVPGTTVNDLFSDATRDTTGERIRVAFLSSYDDLAEAGLIETDEDQQEKQDADLVARLRAITGAHR